MLALDDNCSSHLKTAAYLARPLNQPSHPKFPTGQERKSSAAGLTCGQVASFRIPFLLSPFSLAQSVLFRDSRNGSWLKNPVLNL
jgi:hypothetical protein